jgi:hypothetical protein
LCLGGKPHKIRLKFSPDVATILEEVVWHPSQVVERQADGSLVMTLNVLNTVELTELLGHLRKHFQFLPDAEMSMEVDPRVTTFEQVDFLAAQGFNRISMGVQDFTLQVQQASGRIQPSGGYTVHRNRYAEQTG